MSRINRQLSTYLNAARRLALLKPEYGKYVDREDLTPAEKAAISRAAKLPPIYKKRPTQSYLNAAKSLSKYAPSLKKYRRRKTLKPHEKSHIARIQNNIGTTENLFPVTEKQAKKLPKDAIIGGGIRAVRLRNTQPDAKIVSVDKYEFRVKSAGREFLYLEAGDQIDEIMEAAQIEFDNFYSSPRAKKEHIFIYLWTVYGRAGEGFMTFKDFFNYYNKSYFDYENHEKWLLGIVILYENKKIKLKRRAKKKANRR